MSHTLMRCWEELVQTVVSVTLFEKEDAIIWTLEP